MRCPSLVPVAFALCVAAAVSCGGQQKTTRSGESAGPNSEGSSQQTPEDVPQLPSCDDGTCFRCGDGICPTGFFCESNGGVSGCQWSTGCAKSPTCKCLRSELQADPRCSCEDRDGVAFVTCSK